MAPLRNIRNSLLLALESNIIDDEEFLLLYKLNLSKNPDLPFWSYKQFCLEIMSDDECKSEFRFLRGDVYRLVNVLQLPQEFVCCNGLKVTPVEALCNFLKRFS